MSKVSEYVAKHGPSTMFSFKLFSKPTNMDLMIIRTGIGMYLKSYELVKSLKDDTLLIIVEEIDEEMAEIIQDYRGFMLNVVLPIAEKELASKFMNEISYSINFLKLKHEPLGFKEVENNV